MSEVDVLVIGAGPAGLAAAIGARESGIDSILVLEREVLPGGILLQCIHGGFGLHRYNEELTGPEYADRDIIRANELGIKIQCETTVISITNNHVVRCVSSRYGYQILKAKAIVLAMGCRERTRGALCIPGTRCSGIYTAGTAQRFVNIEGYMPGKRIVILGSGDIGLIMARRLTLQGASVLACVEVMPYSSGLKRNVVQCLEDYGIPLYLNHTVTSIMGKKRLTGVTISKVDDNRMPISGTEITLECDTLLLSCGLIPENELSMGAGIELSSTTSGAIVDETFETSIPGIFACGNVLHVHDLVDNVSHESFKAGKAAANYIKKHNSNRTRIYVKDGSGVKGVVPQIVNSDCDEDIDFMFRPSMVFLNSSVIIEHDGVELVRRFFRILVPGEMVIIKLPLSYLNCIRDGELLIRIEKGQMTSE